MTLENGSARPKNIFELIEMVADNPRLTVVTGDGMIKISALECPPNQAKDKEWQKT